MSTIASHSPLNISETDRSLVVKKPIGNGLVTGNQMITWPRSRDPERWSRDP